MAKFRDLKGNFFSIPEEVLEKHRILPEELASRLGTEQVSGTEIGETTPPPRTGAAAPRIIVNQFFTPMKDPNVKPETNNDFAAQYGFPGAWGTK